jgi:predicted nuclease with TOPRIM domain
VIEYAILFGLGFLTATLLALLIAPAIHRRIVAYTENRIRATMPISPQEVRAQKDMARALYAAENAKVRQELDTEREKNTSLRLANEAASSDAYRLGEQNRSFSLKIEELTLEIGELRAALDASEERAGIIQANLAQQEQAANERASQMSDLTARLTNLTRELDDSKILAATRDLEAEQAKQSATRFRKEGETATRELQDVAARNKEAMTAVARESRKVTRLEEQVATLMAKNADLDTMLTLRNQEAARLKEQLAATGGRANDMIIRLPNPAVPVEKAVNPPPQPAPAAALEVAPVAEAEATPAVAAEEAAISPVEKTTAPASEGLEQEIEDIRNQGTALTERLLNVRGTGNDEPIRREIARIAAEMIALTAAQEGETSPIPGLLAKASGSSGRDSLAKRAKVVMEKRKH